MVYWFIFKIQHQKYIFFVDFVVGFRWPLRCLLSHRFGRCTKTSSLNRTKQSTGSPKSHHLGPVLIHLRSGLPRIDGISQVFWSWIWGSKMGANWPSFYILSRTLSSNKAKQGIETAKPHYRGPVHVTLGSSLPAIVQIFQVLEERKFPIIVESVK